MTAAGRSHVLSFATRVQGMRGSPIGDLDTLLAGHPDVITLAGGTPNPSDIPVAEISHFLSTEIEADPDVLAYGLTEEIPPYDPRYWSLHRARATDRSPLTS